MKPQLKDITLVCVDCVDAVRAAKVIEICKSKADFGAIKLLTSQEVDSEHRVEIAPLTSLVMYSVWMLTRLYKYVDTSHVLVVQRDGFILNADKFDPAWLELDYIAPLFVQCDKVGSGGFSLRSRRIMEHAAGVTPFWDGTEKSADLLQKSLGYYEDGVLSLGDKFKHFKKATLAQGADFGQGGNRNPAYFREKPFGFHRTFQNIDFATGTVDSTDMIRDLNASYDKEIDELYTTL